MRKVLIIANFTALTLLLPAIFGYFGVNTGDGLGGVDTVAKKPIFSLSSFADGSFQKAFYNWFDQNLGLRESAVRTDNQINYTLFDEYHKTPSNMIVVGEDGYLNEYGYVRALNQFDHVNNDDLKYLADQLYQTQELFRSKGKGFVFLITPNKARIMDEYVKDKHKLNDRSHSMHNLERFIPILEEKGINYLSASETFRKWKSEGRGEELFAKVGSHWSEYASCEYSKIIIDSLESELGQNIGEIECEKVPLEEFGERDQDLLRLMNLWSSKLARNNAYGVSSTIYKTSDYQPNLLFVGDSFMWNIFDHLDGGGLYQSRDMYYYYNTNSQYPENTKKTIETEPREAWESQILAHDAVVVEINESAIGNTGFGFLQDVLAHIE